VPVLDENAFPYGWFRSRNIKNDYAAERHVTNGKTSEFIYKMDKNKMPRTLYSIVSQHNSNKSNITTCTTKYENVEKLYNDFVMYPLFTCFKIIVLCKVKVNLKYTLG
jgi:hypothetical protein